MRYELFEQWLPCMKRQSAIRQVVENALEKFEALRFDEQRMCRLVLEQYRRYPQNNDIDALTERVEEILFGYNDINQPRLD